MEPARTCRLARDGLHGADVYSSDEARGAVRQLRRHRRLVSAGVPVSSQTDAGACGWWARGRLLVVGAQTSRRVASELL